MIRPIEQRNTFTITMASSSTTSIRFYFDFISPYAFLAWTQMPSIAKRHGGTLEPIPVLFAALLDKNGQKGPAEIPSKRRYLFKDVARKAWRLGVTNLAPPVAHPFNPLTALRVSGSVDDLELRVQVIDALYKAVWTRRMAIDSPEAVTAVLNDAGLDGAKLTSAATSQEAKDRLRANTEAALSNNVFGVPTIVVDGELFWGTDTLIDVESFMKGDLPRFSDAEWDKIPRAADRKAVKG